MTPPGEDRVSSHDHGHCEVCDQLEHEYDALVAGLRRVEGALADAAIVPTNDIERGIRLLTERLREVERERDRLNEPRAGVSRGCPNCDEVWPARLAEARGEIARLRVAYDRDVQVEPAGLAEAHGGAEDYRQQHRVAVSERDEARAMLAQAEQRVAELERPARVLVESAARYQHHKGNVILEDLWWALEQALTTPQPAPREGT